MKDLLKEHNISQSTLAKAIGYTQRAVSKWVNGETEPTETAIIKTAEYFGITTDLILGQSEECHASSTFSPTTTHASLVLGERIQELRKERNISQSALANILGVTRQAYSRYERGEKELGYEALIKLATFFDVSIDYLLERSDDFGFVTSVASPALTDDEKQLLALFAKMSHPMKIRALAYCEGLLSSDPKRASKA